MPQMRPPARHCAAGLLPSAMLLLALGACKEQNHYAAPPPPKVAVVHPEQRKITRYLEATGNTAPVNSVDLVARVQGFLQDVSYKDGDEAKKGDILFTIEPLPYQSKLQQAQAAESQQQAVVKHADAEYTRQAALGRSDFASQSGVEQALSDRDSARAALQQAQANTQQAAINYTYTRVTAPFSGVVTARLVSVGQLVGGNDATKLATIVQLDPIYVNFTVSDQDVQRIRTMLAARGKTLRDIGTIPVEVGLQTEEGYPHAGVLDYAAPTVDQGTGTLTVRGVFANTDRVLLPGYYVRVRVPVERDADAILVPEQALGSGQGGRYVLAVTKDNRVEQRNVGVGPSFAEMRVVEGGLTPEDRIIVGGIGRVSPGDLVDPQPASTKAAAAAPQAGTPGTPPGVPAAQPVSTKTPP